VPIFIFFFSWSRAKPTWAAGNLSLALNEWRPIIHKWEIFRPPSIWEGWQKSMGDLFYLPTH